MHVNNVKGMTLKKISGLEIIHIFEINMNMSDKRKKIHLKGFEKIRSQFWSDTESCPDWEGPTIYDLGKKCI